MTGLFLCGWRDSNPHASRRQILSLIRLPISPHPLLRPKAQSLRLKALASAKIGIFGEWFMMIGLGLNIS